MAIKGLPMKFQLLMKSKLRYFRNSIGYFLSFPCNPENHVLYLAGFELGTQFSVVCIAQVNLSQSWLPRYVQPGLATSNHQKT